MPEVATHLRTGSHVFSVINASNSAVFVSNSLPNLPLTFLALVLSLCPYGCLYSLYLSVSQCIFNWRWQICPCRFPYFSGSSSINLTSSWKFSSKVLHSHTLVFDCNLTRFIEKLRYLKWERIKMKKTSTIRPSYLGFLKVNKLVFDKITRYHQLLVSRSLNYRNMIRVGKYDRINTSVYITPPVTPIYTSDFLCDSFREVGWRKWINVNTIALRISS